MPPADRWSRFVLNVKRIGRSVDSVYKNRFIERMNGEGERTALRRSKLPTPCPFDVDTLSSYLILMILVSSTSTRSLNVGRYRHASLRLRPDFRCSCQMCRHMCWKCRHMGRENQVHKTVWKKANISQPYCLVYSSSPLSSIVHDPPMD
jgi:hypothetical protein